MGEAIVRLARRAARHSMTMVLMEGIVMFVWSFINVGVFRCAVIWDVSNRRCRSSCKVDAGYGVVAESKYLSTRGSELFVLSVRDYIARDDDTHVICTCLLVCECVTIHMQRGNDQ